MKTIEIVVHCYAVDRPWYAALLCYQLSSLVLHKPKKCKVIVTVFCSLDDENTCDVVDFFMIKTSLDVIPYFDHVLSLKRRNLGRNHVAKTTAADIVWFTDCDYYFGVGCLDTLATLEWPENAVLVFPDYMKEQHTEVKWFSHLKQLVKKPCVIDLNLNADILDYFSYRPVRAIGGIQIVQGDYARKFGYCPEEESAQTQTDGKQNNFFHTKYDLKFRKYCKRNGKHPDFQQPIQLPNLFRMSHPNRKQTAQKAKEVCGW